MMGSRKFFGSVLDHREGAKLILSEAANVMPGWLLGGIFSADFIPDKMNECWSVTWAKGDGGLSPTLIRSEFTALEEDQQWPCCAWQWHCKTWWRMNSSDAKLSCCSVREAVRLCFQEKSVSSIQSIPLRSTSVLYVCSLASRLVSLCSFPCIRPIKLSRD